MSTHFQLLHDSLGGISEEGSPAGCKIRAQGIDHGREGVRVPGGTGGRVFLLRGPQRGAGDPGHHQVHAGEAVGETHVEGLSIRLHHRRPVLLPRGADRLLRLRQLRAR